MASVGGFLKVLGTVAKVVGQVISGGWLDTAVKLIPGDKDDKIVAAVKDPLVAIVDMVTYVEVIGQTVSSPLPGAEKLKGVTPLVIQVLLKAQPFAGKPIDQPELFQAGAQQIAAGIADCLNALKPVVESRGVVE